MQNGSGCNLIRVHKFIENVRAAKGIEEYGGIESLDSDGRLGYPMFCLKPSSQYTAKVSVVSYHPGFMLPRCGICFCGNDLPLLEASLISFISLVFVADPSLLI